MDYKFEKDISVRGKENVDTESVLGNPEAGVTTGVSSISSEQSQPVKVDPELLAKARAQIDAAAATGGSVPKDFEQANLSEEAYKLGLLNHPAEVGNNWEAVIEQLSKGS